MFIIQGDGTTESFVSTFNCSNVTYKFGDDWKAVNPESVGSEWFKAACN